MSDTPAATAITPEAEHPVLETTTPRAESGAETSAVAGTAQNTKDAITNVIDAGTEYANNFNHHESAGHIASLREMAEQLPLMNALRSWWGNKDMEAKRWWIESSLTGNLNPLAAPKRGVGGALAGLILIGAIPEDENTIRMVENEVLKNANIASVLLSMISVLGITAPITATLAMGVQAVHPLLKACEASRRRQAPSRFQLVQEALAKTPKNKAA